MCSFFWFCVVFFFCFCCVVFVFFLDGMLLCVVDRGGGWAVLHLRLKGRGGNSCIAKQITYVHMCIHTHIHTHYMCI